MTISAAKIAMKIKLHTLSTCVRPLGMSWDWRMQYSSPSPSHT